MRLVRNPEQVVDRAVKDLNRRIRVTSCAYDKAIEGREYDVWKVDGHFTFCRTIEKVDADEPAYRVFTTDMFEDV